MPEGPLPQPKRRRSLLRRLVRLALIGLPLFCVALCAALLWAYQHRLDLVNKLFRHLAPVAARAGAFELDDREGELRDLLHSEVTRWRAALRRTVLQAVDAGHLDADTPPEQLAGEIAAPGKPWGWQDPEVWREFLAFLEEEGLVERGLTAEELWTDDLVG